MKIYNTSCFEKLKIRPINVNDIRMPFSKESLKKLWIDPKTISISDIMPGYMVRTGYEIRENDVPNIWIFFDHQHIMKFCKDMDYIIDYFNENEVKGVFLRSKPTIESNFSFMTIESFMETWPKNHNRNDMTITDVWKTDINIDEICTLDSLLAFYKKHNLYDL